jgi:hypothetical protein
MNNQTLNQPTPRKYFMDITPTDCRDFFAELDQVLRACPLPDAGGSSRTVHCSEFMIMGITADETSDKVVLFKHITSRNYIKLDVINKKLYFNADKGAPFNHGVFPSA